MDGPIRSALPSRAESWNGERHNIARQFSSEPPPTNSNATRMYIRTRRAPRREPDPGTTFGLVSHSVRAGNLLSGRPIISNCRLATIRDNGYLVGIVHGRRANSAAAPFLAPNKGNTTVLRGRRPFASASSTPAQRSFPRRHRPRALNISHHWPPLRLSSRDCRDDRCARSRATTSRRRRASDRPGSLPTAFHVV